MAVNASPVNLEQEFVDDALAHFAANPENRDRALARCLFYLYRLNHVADMVETALPQLNAMASNPILSKLVGGKK